MKKDTEETNLAMMTHS